MTTIERIKNQQSQRIAIIGGGLAGIFLSARLLKKGHQVLLFDDQAPFSASKVAAGLYNVITGRVGAKSWMTDTLLPAWKSFLRMPEYQALSKNHVHDLPIYRPFKEVKEYNKWSGRSSDPAYQHLVEFREEPLFPDKINNPFGGIMILPSGWVNISGLIEGMREMFSKNEGFSFFPHAISRSDIDLPKRKLNTESGIIDFDQLVFCEGYKSKENPLFPGLPVIPNKGELLTIEAPELKAEIIYSRRVYLIPLGEDQYLTGSTYFNHFSDPYPSEKGKEEICTYLDRLIKVPYKVLDHRAGIRPTTPDRRPILGTHPEHSYVHIFTGFGTKGILLAPYFSEMMCETILDPTSNPISEVHLNRFFK